MVAPVSSTNSQTAGAIRISTDNYVTVSTQWPGRSAEEVEQQVTIPVEIQMPGMPHMTFLRSESIFGLSFVIMIFDDNSVND